MDLDDRPIDHGVFHVRLVRGSIEQALENVGLDPIPKPLEHRVPLPEQRRQIAP
jgi:hypothetical protein